MYRAHHRGGAGGRLGAEPLGAEGHFPEAVPECEVDFCGCEIPLGADENEHFATLGKQVGQVGLALLRCV